MTKYTHLINGMVVDFTPEEEAIKDAEDKAWNDNTSIRKLAEIRNIRNQKLQETDWLVISEKITDEEKTWRENLRKVPQDFSADKYDELLKRNNDGSLKHSIWSNP